MLKIPKQIDYQFIARILSDDISQEEKEYFESWLSESEKNREIFGEIAFLWDKTGLAPSVTPPDPQEQWLKIKQKIESIKKDAEITISDPEIKIIQLKNFKESFRKRVTLSIFIKIAAVVSVFAVSSLLFYSISRTTEQRAKITNNIKMYDAITRKGEKIELRLSDGSNILVNSDSKLIYPNIFDSNFRDVELFGEAFFSVASNSEKPFRVKCGNTITIVRGTEFNIRNRKNTVRVVVANGLVDTYVPNSNITYSLKKGDMVFYDNQTGKSEHRKVDMNKHIAWKNGKLVFDRTYLADVMEEIERCFNVDVKFSNQNLKRKTLTGIFDTDSIDKVLSVISLTLDVQIAQNGRELLVKGNGI